MKEKIKQMSLKPVKVFRRKYKVFSVEESQEEMILPVSLTQSETGRLFIHMFY